MSMIETLQIAKVRYEGKDKIVLPPADSIDPYDFVYVVVNKAGERTKIRFPQGWDAKLKGQLMEVARDPGAHHARRAKALKLLVEAGWSTKEREGQKLQEARDRIEAAKAKTKAEVESEVAEGTDDSEPEVDEADILDGDLVTA